MTACASCGADVLPGSGFCRGCGDALAAAAGAPARGAPARDATPPAGVKLVAVVCVLAGCAGIALLAFGAMILLFVAGLGGGILAGLVGIGISWGLMATGWGAWKGRAWARLGAIATLGVLAFMGALGLLGAAMGGGSGSIGVAAGGALALWGIVYLHQAEARAWFGAAKKA